MASCGGACSSFSASGSVWFKVDESLTWDGTQWATQKLKENGSKYTFKLPADLQDGEYLIRHEIIALHEAASPGGAQVSC
jgi:hypothetical protein